MKIYLALITLFLSFAIEAKSAELLTAGCMDATACNYDNTAVTDDGSCEYLTCAGCTDDLACNYDSSKSKNDGSCVFAVVTCESCSWSGGANPADGSGTLLTTDSDGDGICDGDDSCSDTSACNYDANPTASCVMPVQYYHDEDGDNIGDYSIGFFCAGDVIPANSTIVLGIQTTVILTIVRIRLCLQLQQHK